VPLVWFCPYLNFGFSVFFFFPVGLTPFKEHLLLRLHLRPFLKLTGIAAAFSSAVLDPPPTSLTALVDTFAYDYLTTLYDNVPFVPYESFAVNGNLVITPAWLPCHYFSFTLSFLFF